MKTIALTFQLLIMTTYYAAQLCFALSVVDCKASYQDALKQQQRLGNTQHLSNADGNESVVLDDGTAAVNPLSEFMSPPEDDSLHLLSNASAANQNGSIIAESTALVAENSCPKLHTNANNNSIENILKVGLPHEHVQLCHKVPASHLRQRNPQCGTQDR